MSEKFIWWEKTVEYFFIQNHFKLNAMVAPLDGDHEKCGDTLFANEGLWTIIEFKKDENSIKDEFDKFDDYAKAKETLKDQDGCHLIIYGYVVEENEKYKFRLNGQNYFSETKVTDFLNQGVSLEIFKDYLTKFLQFKKRTKAGSTSGSFRSFAVISIARGKIKSVTSDELNLTIPFPSIEQSIDTDYGLSP